MAISPEDQELQARAITALDKIQHGEWSGGELSNMIATLSFALGQGFGSMMRCEKLEERITQLEAKIIEFRVEIQQLEGDNAALNDDVCGLQDVLVKASIPDVPKIGGTVTGRISSKEPNSSTPPKISRYTNDEIESHPAVVQLKMSLANIARIMRDPKAAHAAVMRGTIRLPPEHIVTTDTGGPWVVLYWLLGEAVRLANRSSATANAADGRSRKIYRNVAEFIEAHRAGVFSTFGDVKLPDDGGRF